MKDRDDVCSVGFCTNRSTRADNDSRRQRPAAAVAAGSAGAVRASLLATHAAEPVGNTTGRCHVAKLGLPLEGAVFSCQCIAWGKGLIADVVQGRAGR